MPMPNSKNKTKSTKFRLGLFELDPKTNELEELEQAFGQKKQTPEPERQKENLDNIQPPTPQQTNSIK